MGKKKKRKKMKPEDLFLYECDRRGMYPGSGMICIEGELYVLMGNEY